ncbi:MAG TPA: methylmalonyl Co-A mutase-associated GTPase MeaB [Casimicrobiaceae bacterium]|nr:methylmalonyl Co-A mutase-associated GTPase MeaB [Casimicrobiaceae bacterium]
MEIADRVLRGEIRAIARMLSRAEAGSDEARPALDAMFAHAGCAHVVGITGVSGSGKSTLLCKLAAVVRKSGRKVGIVAIDPSSPFSGGAILGDRIRMGELAGDTGVFVRSMATRGTIGGLARGTLEAVDVLDAAGYDLVFIETVGAGQDEVDVARAAHTTVVVSAPGLGDDIQAIKAGILEIADVHVISKCDKPEANRTMTDLKAMLALGLSLTQGKAYAWQVPVVATSSARNEGIDALLAAIDDHKRMLDSTGAIEQRRAAIAQRRMLKASEEILRERFLRNRDQTMNVLLAALKERKLSPHAAAVRWLQQLQIGDDV